jgi:Sec7-like guanine-nucleotide exchange factor
LLDKTKIGEYIGEDIALNKAVLYHHIDSFDFCGVGYIESMKRVLATFRLPGEG